MEYVELAFEGLTYYVALTGMYGGALLGTGMILWLAWWVVSGLVWLIKGLRR